MQSKYERQFKTPSNCITAKPDQKTMKEKLIRGYARPTEKRTLGRQAAKASVRKTRAQGSWVRIPVINEPTMYLLYRVMIILFTKKGGEKKKELKLGDSSWALQLPQPHLLCMPVRSPWTSATV